MLYEEAIKNLEHKFIAYQKAKEDAMGCMALGTPEERKAFKVARETAKAEYKKAMDEILAIPKTPEQAKEIMKFLAL